MVETYSPLIDNIGKFSKSENNESSKKQKSKKLTDDIIRIKEEIEQTGTLSQDPEKMAKIQEEERLNKKALDLDTQFNDIIEQVTGVNSTTEYSEIAARQIGKGKNENVFFVPPSHDDYRGPYRELFNR